MYHDLKNFIGVTTDEIRGVRSDKEMVRLWKNMLENFPRQCEKFIIVVYERHNDLYKVVIDKR